MVYRPSVDAQRCFVLLPLRSPFLGYFDKIIKPAALEVGLNAVKADDIYGTRAVIKDIWELIWTSKVVIAIVAGQNANVNYELGMCHALGIPTILVTERQEDVPFDYRHRRYIRYVPQEAGWEQRLFEDIRNTLRSVLVSSCVEDELSWPYNTFDLGVYKANGYRSSPLSPSRVQDLGNFPAFLPKIIQVVKNAPDNSRIQILCDYVGYGMFNAGEMSDIYRDALMQARKRGCTIHLLVLGSEPFKQMRARVSKADEQWFKQLKETEEFSKCLDAFHDRVRKLGLPLPTTWKRTSHLEALMQVERKYGEVLGDLGIQITVVSGPLPLYLWITKSEAIWVICPTEPNERFPMIDHDLLALGRISVTSPLDECGFFSRDEGLVQRLRYVWQKYNPLESQAASMSQGAGGQAKHSE